MQVESLNEPDRASILQASEDLQSWTSVWETVGVTNDWSGFIDTNSFDFAKRFYRFQLQ